MPGDAPGIAAAEAFPRDVEGYAPRGPLTAEQALLTVNADQLLNTLPKKLRQLNVWRDQGMILPETFDMLRDALLAENNNGLRDAAQALQGHIEHS